MNPEMQKKYQVLARRYRPQQFKDVVGQDVVVTTLKNSLRLQKVAHAYLFCGSRGTGKTTLARLFAKALNCQDLQKDFEPCNRCSSCTDTTGGQSLDVIEIDGASNRGIDDIRQINENIGYIPSYGKYKIYIIDEVHMLTKEAFNALLKTLEEPPEQAKFFFATTESHKVLPTIISRCQRFDLKRISLPQIIEKLQQITKDLSRDVREDALHLIGEKSDGSLRDAESLLDQILCFSEGQITADAVQKVFGLISEEHFFALDTAFSEYRLSYAFELASLLYEEGKDLSHFFSQLIAHYRQIALCKIGGEATLSSPYSERYRKSALLYTQQQSLYILEYLINLETTMQKSLVQRIFLETALLHIIKSKHRIPAEVLLRRLSELEQTCKSEQKDTPLTESAAQVAEKQTPPQDTIANPVEISREKSLPPKETSIKPAAQVAEKQTPPQDTIANPVEISKEKPLPPKETSIKPAAQVAEKQTPPQDPIVNPVEISKEKSLPPKETSIKPAAQVAEKQTPPQDTIANPVEISKEKPLPPKETVRKQDILIPEETPEVKPFKANTTPSPPTHPLSRYDTLIRFAIVELEGSLKK